MLVRQCEGVRREVIRLGDLKNTLFLTGWTVAPRSPEPSLGSSSLLRPTMLSSTYVRRAFLSHTFESTVKRRGLATWTAAVPNGVRGKYCKLSIVRARRLITT